MTSGIPRRRLVALLVGAATLWPFAAAAQQTDRERALVHRILQMHTANTASIVADFLDTIRSQIGWTVQLPWRAQMLEQRRFDGLRLLRQAPAVTTLAQLDDKGIERLRVSRVAMDVVGANTDHSKEPAFTETMTKRVHYGPVYFVERGTPEKRLSEPAMRLSVAGTRQESGVSVAELNLKLLLDLVASARLGARDVAYVVDRQGALMAHPSIGLVFGKADLTGLTHVKAALAAGAGASTAPVTASKDRAGRDVLTTHATVPGPGWLVFLEFPVEDVNALAQ